MSSIKTSVLMVAYNQERYIAQAIESALTQQVDFPIEIVVADDCSTDGTGAIARDYARKHPHRVVLLQRAANMGGRANFADAYKACRGQYVALLDGDDYWTDPTKLNRQVSMLDSHPEWTLCFHRVCYVYEDDPGAVDEFPVGLTESEYGIEDLLQSNFIQTCSLVVRRGLISSFPNWFFLPGPGDWPFALLHARYGRIGYLPEVMAAYRVHGGGRWTRKDRAEAFAESAGILAAFASDLPRRQRRYARIGIANLLLERAVVLAETGRLKLARSTAAESMRVHPLTCGAFSRRRLALLCRALTPNLFRRYARVAAQDSGAVRRDRESARV